jgi:glycosyltransferase involved in cell wall biosynthesis
MVMSYSHLVLSSHPLSGPFRESLAVRLNAVPVGFVTLQDLRSQGAMSGLRRLRSLNCECLWLVTEQPESSCLVPILRLLSTLVTARRVKALYPDGRQVDCDRIGSFAQAPLLVFYSLLGFVESYLLLREAKALQSESRLELASRELSTPSNILYFKSNLWFGVKAGGSIAHVAGVANALRKSGKQVLLVATERQGILDPEIEFLPLEPPKRYVVPPESNLSVFDRLAFKQMAQYYTAKSPPDLIYHRSALNSISAVQLSRQFQCPLVVEYNGSEVWAQHNWGAKLSSERSALICEEVVLKHAHLVVTVSDVLKQELIQRGIQESRIAFYPNGVDAEQFSPNRFPKSSLGDLYDSLKIDQASFVVGFLGTFGRWHGVEVFAKAIASLAATSRPWLHERKLVFLFVGDGQLMPEVRSALQGCEDFCRLPGLCQQSEAPRYLSLCDVVVSPHVPNPDGTKFFGSPTKLFEYLAIGKPILASKLEQIGEILGESLEYSSSRGIHRTVDNPVSVLLPPGDVASLAGAIQLLVADPDLCQRLSVNARAEALSKYTWRHHVEHILDKLRLLQDSGKL